MISYRFILKNKLINIIICNRCSKHHIITIKMSSSVAVTKSEDQKPKYLAVQYIALSDLIGGASKFQKLWDLIPNDHNKGVITDEMVKLFPKEIGKFPTNPESKEFEFFTLVDSNRETRKIRVIGIGPEQISKHTIGEDPLCWEFTTYGGPIRKIEGTGPIRVVDDKTLFDAGILDLVGGAFPNNHDIIKPADYSYFYRMLFYGFYGTGDPKLGDMIHIPVYDSYGNHGNINRCILIWNGKRFKSPKLICDYGYLPPSNCVFPKFPLEHFSPLGRNDKMCCGHRWISGKIITDYNWSPTIETKDSFEQGKINGMLVFLKKIKVNDKYYYFCGGKRFYTGEVKRMAHIQYLQDHFDVPGTTDDTLVLEIID